MSPEERIGAAVARQLRGAGWQVYAEVEVPGSKRRADIVAVRAGRVLIIETKLQFGWAVLHQAAASVGWADGVLVATGPGPKKGTETARRAVAALGLGWLVVDAGEVREVVQPPHGLTMPGKRALLLDALRPEHRDAAPGNARGDYFTATDEQRRALRALVDGETTGMPVVDVLRVVLGKTPDAATRRAWAKAVRMGQVPGVRSEGTGRGVVLLPDDVTAKGVF